MKLTAILITLLMSVSAFADITVINPASRHSPNAVVTHSFSDAVSGKVYQSANCEDAAKKYERTTDAVMIYDSSIEFAARKKGLNCILKNVKKKTVIWTGQTYFKICRLPSTNVNLEASADRRTMGIASMLATKGHENTFKDKDVNVKIIAYSGSKTVLRALLAGDIDLGFMGRGIADGAGNKIECLHVTDPSEDKYLGLTVDLVIPNFKIAYAIYTNSTDPSVIAKLRAAEYNKGWNTFLKASSTTGSFVIDDMSELRVIRYVQRLSDNW